MRRYATGLAAVLLLAQPALAPVGADAPSYTIEDLGTINGLVPAVTGVNAAGDVSGYVIDANGTSRAVYFTEPGGWSFVPGLETALASDAQDINVHGDLTGYVVTNTGNLRAYRYTATTGVVQLIEPLAGGSYTMGFGINASGEVAGIGDTSDAPGTSSFRASPGLPAQKLPSLNGSYLLAMGINDAGQIVGAADVPNTNPIAQHTVIVDADNTLHHFGGLNGSSTSSGLAIDNAGRTVGQASIDAAGTTLHAFKSAASLIDLDSFGSAQSSAEGIADGTSVGFYTLADGVTTHAFVHTDADGTVDLNTRIPDNSGGTLTKAHANSTSGQIVGEGLLNGEPRVFRLTPKVVTPPPPPPGDTVAPTILSLRATPNNIWPANGQWVTVALSVQASDDSGVAPACQLTKISADEAAIGDAKIVDASTGLVRALRDKHQEQRVYTFQVTCGDQAGNQSLAEVNVTVAKNRDFGAAAIKRAALQHKCVLALSTFHKGKGKGRR